MTALAIVNPETGRTVAGPSTGHSVEVLREEDPRSRTRKGHVVVEIRPSFRPGMEYDLGSYPADWIVA